MPDSFLKPVICRSLAQKIYHFVFGCPIQPCFNIVNFMHPVAALPKFQENFLDNILRILIGFGKTQCQCVQFIFLFTEDGIEHGLLRSDLQGCENCYFLIYQASEIVLLFLNNLNNHVKLILEILKPSCTVYIAVTYHKNIASIVQTAIKNKSIGLVYTLVYFNTLSPRIPIEGLRPVRSNPVLLNITAEILFPKLFKNPGNFTSVYSY